MRFDDTFELIALGETADNIKNHRMVLVKTQHGFRLTIRVASSETSAVVVPEDSLSFVFALKTKDPNFHQYSLVENTSFQLYLFANEVPTNLVKVEKDELTGEITVSPDNLVGEPSLLPLMAESTRINSGFLMSEEDTLVLKNNFLAHFEPSRLLGLIYLRVASDELGKSLLMDFSDSEINPPNFKLHFDNIETHWKYKKTANGFEAETADKKPLTKFGYIEIKPDIDFVDAPYPTDDPALAYHYPNPTPGGNIEIQPASGSDPEKIYSVIFI